MKLPSLVRLSFGTATCDDGLIAQVERELEIAQEELIALVTMQKTFDKQHMEALHNVRETYKEWSAAKEALENERDEAKMPQRRLDMNTQFKHWTTLKNGYNWASRALTNVNTAVVQKQRHIREIEKRLRALRGEEEKEGLPAPPLQSQKAGSFTLQ